MKTSTGLSVRAVNSANVRIDNTDREGRAYDISGNAEISGTTVTSLDGQVNKGETSVADFSCWSEDGISVNFHNVPQAEQCGVLTAVQEFIAGAREMVADSSQPVLLKA